MLVKEFRYALGITDDHSTDGRFGGILNTQGERHDVVLVQQLYDLKQRSYLVLKKDRKLPHLGAVKSFGSSRCRHLVERPQ